MYVCAFTNSYTGSQIDNIDKGVSKEEERQDRDSNRRSGEEETRGVT